MATKKHDDEKSKLTPEQLAAMSPDQLRQVPAEELSHLKPEQLAGLSQQQRDSLTNEQKDALSKKQTKALEDAGTNPGNPENVNLAPGYNPNMANERASKTPHYAAGQAPATGDWGARPAGQGATDTRLPPENVSVGSMGGDATKDGGSKPELAKAAATTEAAVAPTPASVGLPRPELRPGLDPLPEEDPTPSTVPIPPPGPRRVA